MVPLHHAAGMSAPPAFIRKLISLNPEGAVTIDAKGRLPLHYAGDYQASFDAVKILLEANPSGIVTFALFNMLRSYELIRNIYYIVYFHE
jgi:ankyrin repeat protein